MDVADWRPLAEAMVEHQIRLRGIKDERVLRAMESIPRHEFVPGDVKSNAYRDAPLEIGLKQTISQPYIVAYMSDLLAVSPEHRVLEVGTGSGYQTAVLASLAETVYTIDIHEQLLRSAEARLAALGFTNIHFDVRSGYSGWPEFAPFDRIMVTAGASAIPRALLEQLAVGGRMVIPVGPAFDDQVLQLVVKLDAERTHVEDKIPVRFVPLLESL